jgi:hypothetical protein
MQYRHQNGKPDVQKANQKLGTGRYRELKNHFKILLETSENRHNYGTVKASNFGLH